MNRYLATAAVRHVMQALAPAAAVAAVQETVDLVVAVVEPQLVVAAAIPGCWAVEQYLAS